MYTFERYEQLELPSMKLEAERTRSVGFGSKLVHAIRATRALHKNPEDTEQVFNTLGALRSKTLPKAYLMFKKTPLGMEVVSGELNIVDILKNREYLASLPVSSLGRAYFEFTKTESLSADGLVDASTRVISTVRNDELRRYICWLRDTHDLWHTLTQYGRDPLGETCLLAFTYAQTRNHALLFLIFSGIRKLRRGYGRSPLPAIFRAYKDGKRARWLPQVDWREQFSLPIEEVRKSFGLVTPTRYQAIYANVATLAS